MLIRLSITIAGVLLALLVSVVIGTAQATRQPPQRYLPAAGAQAGQPFRDPRGHYHLCIPLGWEVTLTGDEPVFRNGTSWIQIRSVNANSSSEAVDEAAGLFKSQYTAFNTINRGGTTIASRSSYGLNVDATTTGGQRVSVLLTAQPDGKKQYFVLVSETPVAQAAQLNASVMILANSVRFEGE